MRNPVEIRKEELSAALEGREPVADSLVSLGADVLFTRSMGPVDGSDLPEPMALVRPRLVNVLSVAGVLANKAQIADQGGREAVERWAQQFADLGAALADRNASREEAWLEAHKAVLRDFYDELVELASTSALAAWAVGSSEGDLSAMPTSAGTGGCSFLVCATPARDGGVATSRTSTISAARRDTPISWWARDERSATLAASAMARREQCWQRAWLKGSRALKVWVDAVPELGGAIL